MSWSWFGRTLSGDVTEAVLLAVDRRQEIAVAWMSPLLSRQLLAVVVPAPAIESFVSDVHTGAARATAAGSTATAFVRDVPREAVHSVDFDHLMSMETMTRAVETGKYLDFSVDDDRSELWSWRSRPVRTSYRHVMVAGMSMHREALVAWAFDPVEWTMQAAVGPTSLLEMVANDWTERSQDAIAATGEPRPLRAKVPTANLFAVPVDLFSRWLSGELANTPELATAQNIAASLRADGFKPCPDCAEEVPSAARECRFCGHLFEPADIPGERDVKASRRAIVRDLAEQGHSPGEIGHLVGMGETRVRMMLLQDEPPPASNESLRARLVTGSELAHVVSSAALRKPGASPRAQWTGKHHVIEYPGGSGGRIEAAPDDEFILVPRAHRYGPPDAPIIDFRCWVHDVYGSKLNAPFFDVTVAEFEALTPIDDWRERPLDS